MVTSPSLKTRWTVLGSSMKATHVVLAYLVLGVLVTGTLADKCECCDSTWLNLQHVWWKFKFTVRFSFITYMLRLWQKHCTVRSSIRGFNSSRCPLHLSPKQWTSNEDATVVRVIQDNRDCRWRNLLLFARFRTRRGFQSLLIHAPSSTQDCNII